MQKVCHFYLESRKYLQSSLEHDNPTKDLNLWPSDDLGLANRLCVNFFFLTKEIGCRPLLLVDRCARCAYATSLCARSIFYMAVGKTPPSFDCKGYFCQEFRYLAAESFELIGVVACSILLLPFNRNSSSRPIHNLVRAQLWIEKTAERISGERKYTDYTQAARSEKSTLYEMQRISGVDEEQRGRWVNRAVDFDDITWKIDQSKHRRIARNYLSEPALNAAKEQLQTDLSFFRDFVSDMTRAHAICKQRERLILMKNLIGDSSASTAIEELLSRWEEILLSGSAFKDEKLKYFNDLSMEIEKTIAKLHTMHDPDHKVQRELESLGRNICRAFSDTFKRLIENGQPFSLRTVMDRFHNHFYFVSEKLRKIQFEYSYQNIENPLAFEAETFIADLLAEINRCQRLFNEANPSWDVQQLGNLPLDRQRALNVLGLDEKATPQTVQTAYRQLALIHHPDKGGDEAVFKIICQAYEYLREFL